MDRLRAFEVFSAVAAKGGFARAADTLGTSPANVTRYVAELESYLGTRLLNRTSRHVSLTEAGHAFLQRIDAVLSDVDEAVSLANSSAVTAKGRLRVNAPVSFGIGHLAPLWPEFLTRHPGIELEIDLADRVIDLVEEGFDLAIRISRGGSQMHIARKLATSRNLIVASPDYLAAHGTPATPDELATHPAIAYTLSSMATDWELTGGSGDIRKVSVRAVMRSNNGDTVRAAALAGMGVTWQPAFLIGEDIAAGRLVPLLPDYRLPDIDILALYPSRLFLAAKVRVLIDFLVEKFTAFDRV